MKKVYKVENVDCAHCAMAMQNFILKVDGVESATLNFLTKRLTSELDESRIDEIMVEVEKACKKVDREVYVVK